MTAREKILERWDESDCARERLVQCIAEYIECQYSDLIDELQQLLGKQITSLDIAKCIDKETFLDFEDGGKERFRLKILRSIYGVYQ